MRYNNILEAIGRTPLVKLNRLTRGSKAAVYAKCDHLNPGGSVKDRIVKEMVLDAEKNGLLKPGGTIIEAIRTWNVLHGGPPTCLKSALPWAMIPSHRSCGSLSAFSSVTLKPESSKAMVAAATA